MSVKFVKSTGRKRPFYTNGTNRPLYEDIKRPTLLGYGAIGIATAIGAVLAFGDSFGDFAGDRNQAADIPANV